MLRSEDMSLIILYLNRDIAKQGIQHIGQNPSIHFLNLNAHLKIDQLPFNKEIRFLEKLFARIKFFEDECRRIEKSVEVKIKSINLEEEIDKHYNRLVLLREIRRDTLETIKILKEDMFVVEELESYIANNTTEESIDYETNLDHVCFVISLEKKNMLESVLNYNLRRNAYVFNNDKTIFIYEADKFYNVSGYIIFTHGLCAVEKIEMLVTSLGGRIISDKSINTGAIGINDKIVQICKIYENNERAIENELQSISGKLNYWKYCVSKEMKIYVTMNGLGFVKDRDNWVGQGFVLKNDLNKIKKMCDYITKKYGYAHFDLIKHYSYNDVDEFELNVETMKTKGDKMDEYAYEMYESDSDIQIIMKNTEENGIKNKVIDKKNSDEFNKANNSNTKKVDKENMAYNKKPLNILCSKNESNFYAEKNQGTNCNAEKTENSNQRKLDKAPVMVKTNAIGTETPTKNSLYKTQPYNANLNPKPSIIAVDEEKVTSIDLQNFAIEKPETPPTYFYTNKFTRAFQDLNDVYGVPDYKEINPAAFYIVTFPFMFGVMFGDAGHGLILLLISLYLIRKEKTIKVPEFLEQIFTGRYIMLICSIWSIFFGFLYSDFLSLAIPLFPSGFTKAGGNYIKTGNYTYPFGIDHTWHHKSNAPQFFNSLKMKMSVILGFAHMLLGSILSILNSKHKNDKITILCVVIPQTVAFLSFIGYLIFLVFYKWISTQNRQGIISVIVSMFTSPFTVVAPMYPYQKEVQLFLCSNIIISFMWMFFTKPMYETMKYKRKMNRNANLTYKNDDDGDELMEIWMHGAIETIEFGIGLVSNTSSYLRLWAISLAHAELTNVLNTMTIASGGVIKTIIMFPFWLFFTVALLIGLEGLSSCLHALRLNWIEFNSKFYKGTGYPFRPLDFKTNYDD